MGFIEEWNEAIDSDPTWQFEELYEELEEEDPKLAEEFAEVVWYVNAVAALASSRLALQGIHLPYDEVLEYVLAQNA